MRKRHSSRMSQDSRTRAKDAPQWLTPLSGTSGNILLLGLAALVAGMCVLPAGPSFNPSKPYQYLLAFTLYLPALVIGFRQPGRWWVLLSRPPMMWLVALMAWSAVTLAWTDASRPVDEALRLLAILVFLFAWYHTIGSDAQRLQRLLLACSCMLAMAAIAAMVRLKSAPPADGRMSGLGVMANPNLFAAALSMGVLWLVPWRMSNAARNVSRCALALILLVGVFLTGSRSATAALLVALMILLWLANDRIHRGLAAALALMALTTAALEYSDILARGWSFRPAILVRSWELFVQRPWTGHGLGATMLLPVEGHLHTHAHNLTMQLGFELGIPGVALWWIAWCIVGHRAWRVRADVVGRLTVGSWVFATLLVQFDLPHLLDSPRPGWLMLWFPFAMSLSLPAPHLEDP